MTLRNRSLVRKPLAMLRANSVEQDDLDWLVDYLGGGERSAVLREELVKLARAKRHEMNSLAPSRLDKSAFGSMRAA